MSNVLFGGKVSASKPLAIEANDEAHLHITHAALAPAKDGKAKKGDGNPAPATVLSVTIGGEQFVLATFRPGQVEQCELNLPLHAATGKTYYLNVEGAGEVHVTGVYEEIQDDGFPGSDDGFGDFDDEDDSDEMELDDVGSDSDDGLTPSHVKVEEVKDSESESESDKKPAEKQAGKEKQQQQHQGKKQGKKEKKEAKKEKEEKKQQPQSGKESKKRAEPEGGKSSEQPAKKAKQEKGEGAFKCAPCERTFETQKALDQHNQSKHKSS